MLQLTREEIIVLRKHMFGTENHNLQLVVEKFKNAGMLKQTALEEAEELLIDINDHDYHFDNGVLVNNLISSLKSLIAEFKEYKKEFN